MGNHDAGRAMGRAAEMAIKMRTTQRAIDLLDEICNPYRGCDAEFEAPDPKNPRHVNPDYPYYTDPNGPLGILIAEAFSPGIDWIKLDPVNSGNEDDEESLSSKWYDGPYTKFRQRYEFC